MQFRDLKAQYTALKAEIDAAMQKVAADGNFISGAQVAELETALAEYVGVKHCVTCGNGTDALTMVLMGWNLGPGDAVFVPDFTFFASGEVVSFEGATPVFVDVDADTFNLDPAKLEEAILAVKADGKLTPKAIVAVDLFGLPADYRAIADRGKIRPSSVGGRRTGLWRQHGRPSELQLWRCVHNLLLPGQTPRLLWRRRRDFYR